MCLILSTMNGKTDVYHQIIYPRWYYYGLPHIYLFFQHTLAYEVYRQGTHYKDGDKFLHHVFLEPTDYMPSENITKYLLHQTSKMTRKDHHEIHGGFLYKNEDYTHPYIYSVANNQSNLLAESQKLTVPGIHHKIVEIEQMKEKYICWTFTECSKSGTQPEHQAGNHHHLPWLLNQGFWPWPKSSWHQGFSAGLRTMARRCWPFELESDHHSAKNSQDNWSNVRVGITVLKTSKWILTSSSAEEISCFLCTLSHASCETWMKPQN